MSISTRWMATFDSVLTRDSNGHHGVSVGDADGDGLDDLYVAQPAGLPNRLYRNRGDSTFEDITEQAGLGVLDDTAQSLFADVDNDGDEDLVLATRPGRCSSSTTAKGASRRVPDAFRFERPLAGRADVDRDGGLRPGRFSRSVLVRLLLFLRRRRGQGGNADAVLRRAQRPARRAVPKRRPRPIRRGDAGGRGSTPATTAITSPRPGPTTTATAGPTCWSRTTSGPRTSTTTSGARDGKVTFEDVAAARACSTTAPA